MTKWPQCLRQGLTIYMGIWPMCPRLCVTFGWRHQVSIRNLLEIDGMNHSGTYLSKLPLTDTLKLMSLTTNIQIAKIE